MERQTRLINEESDEPKPWDPDLQYKQWLEEKSKPGESET
jgi:hypothetical protein